MSPAVDIYASTNPSFAYISPTSDAGAEWCGDHINATPDRQGGYLAEHRYAPDILLAAHNAGLTVAVDGRVCDVERRQAS
jgi:hypothetical protein